VTCQLEARDVRPGQLVSALSRYQISDPARRSATTGEWLTNALRAVAAGIGACAQRILAALHESRRRQAAVERARYRHLIFDAATGICFAMSDGEERRVRQAGPREVA